jgi:uncharacterized membrane protein
LRGIAFGVEEMQVQKLAALFGLLESLLLLRLVALLFAARPDNPWIVLIISLTAPFTAPFRILDQWAGQPQFGARLELATLAAMVIVLIVAVIWQIRYMRKTDISQSGLTNTTGT